MQKILGIIAGLLCALAAFTVQAGANPPPGAAGPKVLASFIADKTAVRRGGTVTVALRQVIAQGWHTYWVNPGDAGEATAIDWKLPAGAAAGPLRWPLPHVIKIGPLVDYGYSGEVLLLSEITLPETLGSSVEIVADVRWLVCKEVCVPEQATVRLRLPVLDAGLSPRPSMHAARIEAARASLPEAAPFAARLEVRGKSLTLSTGAIPGGKGSAVRFYPLQPDVISNSAAQKAVWQEGGALTLRMERAGMASPAAGTTFEGVLVIEDRGGKRRGYRMKAEMTAAAESSGAVSAEAGSGAQPPHASGGTQGISGGSSGLSTASGGGGAASLSIGVALVFAFLGGLILNLMPCIFPVLSLKALSLAGEKAMTERHMHGYAYLGGVLVTCIAFGAALVGLRAGGVAIGWGMQFQSPVFVLVMMALFLGLGLYMSGVFTIGAGRLANAGDRLTHIPGLTGYFFTGVLATVVATPCTAPFMGAAVSYALTQPALQLFAVLLALGLGFALPMLLLSLSPALGRWLPRPGAWMQTFKEVMAFPLYATVGWLMWVLSQQQGSSGVLAGVVALMGVAFAAWLFGSAREPGRWRSGIAAAVALVAIIAGVAGLPAGLQSQVFSTARLEALRAEGRPAFVNLTAAWCITCLVNERVALTSDRVAEAFADQGITYLKGDWTNGDPEITAYLKSFGRVGVPLYVFYPARGEPVVLPQFLTVGIVLDGIAAAGHQRHADVR